MLKQIEPTRDAEAVLLARVYALILSFDEPTPTRADAANDASAHKAKTKKREVKSDDEK